MPGTRPRRVRGVWTNHSAGRCGAMPRPPAPAAFPRGYPQRAVGGFGLVWPGRAPAAPPDLRAVQRTTKHILPSRAARPSFMTDSRSKNRLAEGDSPILLRTTSQNRDSPRPFSCNGLAARWLDGGDRGSDRGAGGRGRAAGGGSARVARRRASRGSPAGRPGRLERLFSL